MKIKSIFIILTVVLLSTLLSYPQTNGKKNTSQNSLANNQAAKSSPAYAELLLQKTELEAQLEDFLGDYTEDFPKIVEIRFELDLIQKQANRFLSVNSADVPKLSLALGKLSIRKIELETNLWVLQKQYKDDYSEVKRLKRKVAVYERAIRDILP